MKVVNQLFQAIGLRTRLLVLISAMTVINLAGSLGTILYTYNTRSIHTQMLDKDVKTLTVAQKLESELLGQKGVTTYFFLTNDAEWLEQLEERNLKFRYWLKLARGMEHCEEDQTLLHEIESKYIQYAFDRGQVIELYKSGKREEGMVRHWVVRGQFHAIYDLAEKFKLHHEDQIAALRKSLQLSTEKMTMLAWSAIPCVIALSVLLTIMLYKQIFKPIHELAVGGKGPKKLGNINNEVTAIKHRMEDLIENVGQTTAKLIQSQEHLIQSEKLAMVGKLAAGVAHSVRNPLTSVKMRLFTLERSLQMTRPQKEDLDVISEEIRHIDTILRNFLEYARPPKLKIQLASPSDVIDMTLQLLKHRFDSYRATVLVKRVRALPEIYIDMDQMKEVFVNLMVNACEAMGEDGNIHVIEEISEHEALGEVVLIHISDDGPGIPLGIQKKIFEPFFSSKEEGSGLGLSIAKRIVEEHGGEICVKSDEGKGATFVIALPMKEMIHG